MHTRYVNPVINSFIVS